MTPKEKAKKLVDKYSTYVVMWSGGIEVETQNVKQCALIAVNEMLEELDHLAFDDHDYGTSKMMYWMEVKNEINKL
jgi:hypothetical protein